MKHVVGALLLAVSAVVFSTPAFAADPDPIVLGACDITVAVGWTNPGTCAQPVSTVDAGLQSLDKPLAAPTQYFEQTFTAAAGSYHVWVRMRALNDSKWNDAVWLQFSDAVNSAGQALYRIGTTNGLAVNLATDSAATSLNGWGWQDGAYWLSQTATVKYTTSGTHVIRVQTREDGVLVDQIILSRAVYLTTAPGKPTNDPTRFTSPPAPVAAPPVAASAPSPAAAAANVAATSVLTWAASANANGYDVYFGALNPPPSISVNQAGTSYQPAAALAPNTTYFWRVDARGAGGTTPGAIWSFTTALPAPPPPPPPPAPSVPATFAPAGGAVNVVTASGLNWAVATNATAYDVFFGTTNPPAPVAANQTATSYQPAAALAASTTYYWRVDARGAGGTTAGPVLTFTTAAPPAAAPGTPTAIAPAAGASNVATTAALSWAAASNATSYDIAFGTTNPPPMEAANVAATSYRPAAALSASTTYYWRVDAHGPGGTTAGSVWTFTTAAPAALAPSAPSVPMPANGNTTALVGGALNWAPSANATTYDVYFGTSAAPPLVLAGQTGTSYQPAATAASTAYYWKIVAIGAGGQVAGPVWTFTTSAPSTPPAPVPAGDAPPTANTMLNRLRVYNWNVAQGYNNLTNTNDYNVQLDLIASLNPDVVTLQEVSFSDADMMKIYLAGLTQRTGKAWRGSYQRGNAETTPTTDNIGSAILTWLPVDVHAETLILDDPMHPLEALQVQVTVNGTPVHISTAHLYAWDTAVRGRQLPAFQAWLSTQGVHRIVAGDFNANPLDTGTWAPAWASEYKDAWLTATSWTQPTDDGGYTFDKRTATGKPERIDYQFTKGMTVSEMFVVKTRRSDHHAVVTDYIIP